MPNTHVFIAFQPRDNVSLTPVTMTRGSGRHYGLLPNGRDPQPGEAVYAIGGRKAGARFEYINATTQPPTVATLFVRLRQTKQSSVLEVSDALRLRREIPIPLSGAEITSPLDTGLHYSSGERS
ncbi:MAG TPA: hypothetical protein VEW42_00765 [Candidatus Eisenbacteria bacterium]|nr:hypothetical protein [Candidatus Eisenbacteria bacterium]